MRRSSFQKVDAENASVDVMLSRDIVSQYDKIAAVAEHIDDVVVVAAEIPTTAIVAASIGAVTAVGSNIDAVVDVHNNTANIATIIDNFANMNTVASNIADVNDVADNIEAVDTVNENMTNIHTTVANIANVGVVAGSITGVNIVASGMPDILTANSNIADITVAADNIAHINQVAADTAQINEIVAAVVPNMAEILLADDRAATATSMAVTATTQAGLANTARVAAEVAKGVAETKATEAGLSAVAADLSADLAAASEAVATTKANAASASADAAHVSELAAASILDTFDDRYLGAFVNNPTVDNDGNALTSGALFFNTTTHNLRVYDAGLVDWIALSGVTFAGLQDVNLASVATGDVLKWNGTDWVNTKVVGLNSLQLLGGVSTQGTMTWNADEETVDVVQNGAILQLGQETQVHVRNSSGSSIADGKVVMATGTLGASGRIVAGLYDGTSDVKYVLGVATETIANGDDGKVTSFGKIRGINTSAWNEGDVLYTTTAGGLTSAAPVTGVKLAVAMVITKHAVNGVIMVRVNGVDELRYEPKNVNIQAHIASTSNPHGVTKTQVGLGSVDNTADSAKNVLSATKWTTGQTLTIGSTGKAVDGSGSVGWSLAEIGAQAAGSYQPLDATLTALAGVTTAADKLVYATGVDTFTTATLTAAGRALLDDADAAAQRTTLGISATNTPSTAVGGIVATNVQAAIAELDSEKVAKVTSTDNAIARFDGTTGAIQNSSVVIDDSSNMSTTGTVQGTQLKSTIATGTAPLTVTSTTAVTNLNADLLDGQHGAYYATAQSVTDKISLDNWRDSMMSKAQFNALAAERRANRAGSGFDEWGRHYGEAALYPNVNDGLWTNPTAINAFRLGKDSASGFGAGISKTVSAYININGSLIALKYLNVTSDRADIFLPPAPTVLPYDATLTQQQIDSGVIKHADASNSGLIVNGKFDTDTSGWSNFDASLSIDTNRLKITSNAGSTSGTFGVQTLSNLVVGKKYIVEFDVISISSGSLLFRVGSGTYTQPFINIYSTTPIIGRNNIEFTATLTNHHIFMGLVTSAGQNAVYDNIAVFPADAISRSDLVFLESWHEDVSEKDFVYPLGNVQYLGTTGDSGTPVVGAFAGSATYSLFSDTWQADEALVGKGYVWSILSDANKKAFVANSENNCYLDGDKVIQVRYRMRVVMLGDGEYKTVTTPYNSYLNPDTLYVLPKGKQVSCLERGAASTNGVYGHGTAGWVSALPWRDEVGIFSASDAYADTNGFMAGSYNGQCFALPIALIHRRNQGAYHPVYNANGTSCSTNNVYNPVQATYWHTTNTAPVTCISDAFGSAKATNVQYAGAIGGVTAGRPDGLFYDQVHEGDILDLRNSSAKVEDYNRLIDREFNKLVAGTYRGSEGEWRISEVLTISAVYNSGLAAVATISILAPFNVSGLMGTGPGANLGATLPASFVTAPCILVDTANISRIGYIFYSGGYGYIRLNGAFTSGICTIYILRQSRTKSNTLTHTDIIGSPANYPTAWKQSGVSGVPLIVAEDGTSLLPTGALNIFKNSRKVTIGSPVIYQVLKSTDSGATWALLTSGTHYSFTATTNTIAFVTAPTTTDLIMVTYQTHTSMAVPAANSEVLEIGDVYVGNTSMSVYGAYMVDSLIRKTPTADTVAPISASVRFSLNTIELGNTNAFNPGRGAITHSLVSLPIAGNPAVKVFPYLTRSNGKARLQLVFKEMKYSAANVDWGDDGTFNIVDTVSTTTDWYGNTVLIGQKYAELPYFIEAKE